MHGSSICPVFTLEQCLDALGLPEALRCRLATLALLKKNCPDRCEKRAKSVLGEYKVSVQERADVWVAVTGCCFHLSLSVAATSGQVRPDLQQ